MSKRKTNTYRRRKTPGYRIIKASASESEMAKWIRRFPEKESLIRKKMRNGWVPVAYAGGRVLGFER